MGWSPWLIVVSYSRFEMHFGEFDKPVGEFHSLPYGAEALADALGALPWAAKSRLAWGTVLPVPESAGSAF
jgi:hypothetical protein